MMHDYTPYLDLPDEPPHGCLRLVERVCRECYGLDLAGIDDGVVTHRDRAERLHAALIVHGREVTEPREGDFILLRALPVHIGLVADPARHLMLHSLAQHHSCLSDWTHTRWRPALIGFWRWVQ